MNHRSRSLPRILSTLLLVILSSAGLGWIAHDTPGGEGTSEDLARQAFENFKALEGEWRGTTSGGHDISLTYSVVADGTAVLSRERMEGHPEMVTVYHLDGGRLMLTHYCSAGNQPRMVARELSKEGRNVRFDMVDATGLASPRSGHMHRAAFEFSARDRYRATWTWNEDGQDGFTVEVDARRVAGEVGAAAR